MAGRFDEFLIDSDDDSDHPLNASPSIQTPNGLTSLVAPNTGVKERESTRTGAASTSTHDDRAMAGSTVLAGGNVSGSPLEQNTGNTLAGSPRESHSKEYDTNKKKLEASSTSNRSFPFEESPNVARGNSSLLHTVALQPSRRSPPRRLSPRAAAVAQKREEGYVLPPQTCSVEVPRRFFCKPPLPRSSSMSRQPAVPPESHLRESPFVLVRSSNGKREVHTILVPEETSDGSTQWVLQQGEADNASRMVVRPPPAKWSQRAEEYMKTKREAMGEEARRREAINSLVQKNHFCRYPPTSFFRPRVAHASSGSNWDKHNYSGYRRCNRLLTALNAEEIPRETVEKLVRTLQPIQVIPKRAGDQGAERRESKEGEFSCNCIAHCSRGGVREELMYDNFTPLARSDEEYDAKCWNYLNLLPIPLARADMPELIMNGAASSSPFILDQSNQQQQLDEMEFEQSNSSNSGCRGTRRSWATLGGIWCTVDGLRESGKPVTPKDIKPPRRVMRICGGHPIGASLKVETIHQLAKSIPVRCYELLFFPQESISPDAVNYGAEGVTLGQMVPPPASSVPLTPRIVVNQDGMLSEYRKKLYTSKSQRAVMQNQHDDHLTFSSSTIGGSNRFGYVTHTIVSVSQTVKFAVELSVILLPFVYVMEEGGKYLVEVPRFCPATTVQYRKIRGLYISFSTHEAFIAAYKALLWATECNVVDISFLENASDPWDKDYAILRLAATLSPLGPWSSFIDTPLESPDEFPESSETDAKQEGREMHWNGIQSCRGKYQTKCLDFMVLNLLQAEKDSGSVPLTLSDFIVEEERGNKIVKKNAIFSDTLPSTKEELARFIDPKLATVVAYTPFGVIRRALNQRTNEVYDVRVIPRGTMKLLPLYSHDIDNSYHSAPPTHEGSEDEDILDDARDCRQLDRDVEAAIILEYISYLPALNPVYGVIADKKNYYIFQEPWVSALAMEKGFKSITGPSAHFIHNPQLKRIADNTVIMTLKDFVHAILHRSHREQNKGIHRPKASGSKVDNIEPRLLYAQLLSTELLLLLVSIHGKGILLGPCPPQRILVRIKTSLLDDEQGVIETGEMGASPHEAIKSQHIQLFVPDLGINSKAWRYERQQCGVLEYLSPLYLLEAMRSTEFGKDQAYWTVYDDWWTFLCLTFELFALDGSSLLSSSKQTSFSTSPTPLLSSFTSAGEILDVWKKVLTSNGKQEMSDVIRELVHERILTSVAPHIESWIASKAEELELFGTTGPRAMQTLADESQRSSTPRLTENYLGVSLSTLYGKTRSSSTSSRSPPREPGEPPPAHAENILEKFSFLFYYRELFDSVLDIFLPATSARFDCAIHSPAVHLFSHPFFRTIPLDAVFDGSWKLPRSCQMFFFRYLRKSRAEQAVAKYRREAFDHHHITRFSVAPLLIDASRYRHSFQDAGSTDPLPFVEAGGQETPHRTGEVFNTHSSNNFDNGSVDDSGLSGMSTRLNTTLQHSSNGEKDENGESDDLVRRALSSQQQEPSSKKHVVKTVPEEGPSTPYSSKIEDLRKRRKTPEKSDNSDNSSFHAEDHSGTDALERLRDRPVPARYSEMEHRRLSRHRRTTGNELTKESFSKPSQAFLPPPHQSSSSCSTPASSSPWDDEDIRKDFYYTKSSVEESRSPPFVDYYSSPHSDYDNPNRNRVPGYPATTSRVGSAGRGIPSCEYGFKRTPPSKCSPIQCRPSHYHAEVLSPSAMRAFHDIEHVLNHLGAPSQTSTCMGSVRSSFWPSDVVESSLVRSGNASSKFSVPQHRERKKWHHKDHGLYGTEPRRSSGFYKSQ